MNKTLITISISLLSLAAAITSVARANEVTPQMINGSDVPMTTYPFAVSITKGHDHQPFCSGALIAERYVLTAGHCVEMDMLYPAGSVFATPNPVKRIIRVAFNNLPGRPVIAVKRAVTWGWFSTFFLGIPGQSDLGLLELVSDAPTSPAELGTLPVKDTALTELGYGPRMNNEQDGMHANLGQGHLTVSAPAACNGQTGSNWEVLQVYAPREFCTSPALISGSAACHGDSGGPALNPVGQIVGVTSWSAADNCNALPAQQHTVFARTDAGLAWMRNQTGAAMGGLAAIPQNLAKPALQVKLKIKRNRLYYHASSSKSNKLMGWFGASIQDKDHSEVYSAYRQVHASSQHMLIPARFFKLLKAHPSYHGILVALSIAASPNGNHSNWRMISKPFKPVKRKTAFTG